jgi:hypothetical protein
MAYTVGTAADAVIAQGGFDPSSSNTSRPVVISWLSLKQQEMVSRSRWLQEDLLIGLTVAGQSEYALDASVVEVFELDVGGTVYERIGQRRLRRLKQGLLGIRVVGVFAPDYSSSGAVQVEVFPAPSNTGDEIRAWAALAAPELSSSNESAAFSVPTEFVEGIIDGAIGLGMLRVTQNPYVADSYDQSFQAKTEELRRRLNSRLSGGATTVQVTA